MKKNHYICIRFKAERQMAQSAILDVRGLTKRIDGGPQIQSLRFSSYSYIYFNH